MYSNQWMWMDEWMNGWIGKNKTKTKTLWAQCEFTNDGRLIYIEQMDIFHR